MSNSTDTTGCISHRQNCRFFVIYEDFRDIARKASGTEHEYKLAAFWRVLETKTNDRITAIPEIAEECKQKGIPIPEEHLWIEMSYADFAKRAQGVYKSSSFQVAAAESERVGFSKSRNRKRPRNPSDPESALEDYKEYLFLADVMQTAITKGELPPPIEINSSLLKSIPERKKKRQEKRAIEKNRDSLLKSIAPPIEINTSPLLKSIGNNNIDKNITNDITNNERESPPNTLDTTAIVSSDTARSQFSLIEAIFFLRKHSYTIEPFAQRKDVFVLQYPSGKEVHISAENIITEADAVALGEAFDTARASLSQDEEMFRNDAPQGDTHATAASGHPHRVGEPAAPGGDSDHGTVDNGHVATPEAGPVLEAQEITEGEHHASRVPTLPRADHPASLERDASRHPQSDNHCAVSAPDDLPVVHPVGRGTPSPQGSRDGKDTSPLTPAQSLPLPQTEQAALGTHTRTRKPAQPKPETPKGPPAEPPADMAWGTRKCLLWFDYWRGGILIGKWKLMQASTCAKGLAEQFDEQMVIQVRTDMEADPYYAAKGGCDVCDVANNIHKYLKRRHNKQKPQSPNVDSATSEPLLSVEEEFGRYWGINEKRVNEKRGVSYATA